MPVPDKFTDWGDAAPLSVIVSLADCAPATAGVKATKAVQEAAGARVVAQVLICVNDVALVPVIVIEIRCTVAVPLLVIFTDAAKDTVP